MSQDFRHCRRRKSVLPWLPIAILAFGNPATLLPAADWPQWRGPNRNGVAAEKLDLSEWPEDGPPRVAWRAEVGKGHAAVSVLGGRAYTLGWDGSRDTVVCLDAADGKPLWKQSYDCKTIVQWPGPRATPNVADDAVYTLGQWGQLCAWNAATGEPVWSRQLDERCNPDIDYGFSSSPLLTGELLVLGYGRKGLAVRTKDGEIAWGDDGQRGACTSPVPIVVDGKPAAIVMHTNEGRTAVELVGIETASGKELWRSPPWREQWGAACVDPLYDDGKVFVTTAEQFRRAGRFSIEDGRVEEDWSTDRFAGYTGGCVLLEECIYGVDGGGMLTCIGWDDGEVRWTQRGFGERGSLIAAGDLLLIQTGHSGELVVAAAEQDGYRELRRAKLFTGDPATFTAPVLAGERIYCRSYEGEVVCVECGR